MTNKTTNSFIQVNDIVLRFKKDILLDHVSSDNASRGRFMALSDETAVVKHY